MRIRPINCLFFCLLLLGFGIFPAIAQEDEGEKEQLEAYREEVKQMVSFLQFSLNVLGDPTVSAKEKDIIINESFLKIFIDDKVQIEDDLVENRDVVTNKDVQAYLKDVDFFFKNVKFEFNNLDIADDLNQEGKLFFTVKMMRNLSGTTVEGDSINTDQERYIEVNVDEENKDLRIASIYTTKLSRNEELTIWWAGLSHEWKTLLGVEIEVKDGLLLSEIQEFSDTTYWTNDMLVTDSIKIIDYVKQAAGKEEINLSGSKVITDLKPLDQLKSLKKIDISSSEITDLFPIRNLTTIEILDCSNTKVENLRPLKYSKSLKQLYINNTPVSSINVIEIFENLEVLHMQHTVIDSIPSVGGLNHLKDLDCSSTNLQHLDSIKLLTALEDLNISNTSVDDLEPIAKLKNLKNLNLNDTKIASLESLHGHEHLQVLSIENTQIDDLSPLKEVNNLEAIYADGSQVDLDDFVMLSSIRSELDIIFMTEELSDFWENLEGRWADLLGSKLQLPDSVSPDQLHDILKIRELDIQNDNEVSELLPLKYMPLLESLDFSETSISDLSPIQHISNLKVLKGANSKVTDLSPIQSLTNLKVIDFQNTAIKEIEVIENLKNPDSLIFSNTNVEGVDVLNKIGDFSIAYFDNTGISDDDIFALTYDEDKSNVIYKSEKLTVWWGNMDDSWQDIFRDMNKLNSRPSAEELHKLVAKKSLDVQGTSIKNLDPIQEFVRLQSLSFADTRVNSLYPLIHLRGLKELKCPGNPLADIEALAPLKTLESLDLDNTQIKDIKALRNLTGLKELKFSGTMVKDISPIEGMEKLEVLEFSKTRVKQVNALANLDNLKVLKCYNNKISEKKIEDFKQRNPDCEVVFY